MKPIVVFLNMLLGFILVISGVILLIVMVNYPFAGIGLLCAIMFLAIVSFVSINSGETNKTEAPEEKVNP